MERVDVEIVALADANQPGVAAVIDDLRRQLGERLDRRWLLTVVAERRAPGSTSDAATVASMTVDERTDVDAVVGSLAAHVNRRRWVTRRAALTTIGGGIAAVVVAACGTKSTSGTAAASSSSAPVSTASTTSSVSSASGTTVALAPEMTAGPYYLDLDLVRSDIREDRAGAPLALEVVVVDQSGTPIQGAAVDIWHCDANGLYSGFAAQSASANLGATASTTDDGTFLRGTQMSDTHGVVRFTTIYPGWYTGRTVHIHAKVRVGGSEVHTGQLFFDDAFTDTVFASTAPYSSRTARDTRNSNDDIFSGGGAQSTLAVQQAGGGYASAMTTAVRTG